MHKELIAQAATFADEQVSEKTYVTGKGEVYGIVNQFGAERALKRGAIGSGVEGTVTVVYRRSKFTDAQLTQARSGSIKIPSLSAVALAVTGMELDATWVTFTVQVR